MPHQLTEPQWIDRFPGRATPAEKIRCPAVQRRSPRQTAGKVSETECQTALWVTK